MPRVLREIWRVVAITDAFLNYELTEENHWKRAKLSGEELTIWLDMFIEGNLKKAKIKNEQLNIFVKDK